MKNKKLLFILIPIILIVAILIAGVLVLTLNSNPKNIFKYSISKAFEAFENTEEQYDTVKGTMNITANIQSDNEEINAINTILNDASIEIGMEADMANMIVNENLKVVYNNENILNAILLLQDQKGYVCMPDWLNKYLEIPEEYLDYSDYTEYSEKMGTVNFDKLAKAVKEELIASIEKQNFEKAKYDNTKASTLSLSEKEFIELNKELLKNLKQNETFNNALGEYKTSITEMIDEMINELEDVTYDEQTRIEFTIFTQGLLNKFVGLEMRLKGDGRNTDLGITFTTDKAQSVLEIYNEYEGEKDSQFKVTIDKQKENKNKGTYTIKVNADEKEFVIICNYEKQGKQTTFTVTTEIEEIKLSISGNVEENDKNIKGNIVFTIEEEEFGKINLNCAYDFIYDVEVKKVDVTNFTSIDELSEEDQKEFETNLQNSALFKLLKKFGLEEGIFSDEPSINYEGYSIKYNVPENFNETSSSTEDMKMYTDGNYNSVTLHVKAEKANTVMKKLEDEYALKSGLYKNQKISEAKRYTVSDKEYQFRTITYEDEIGSYMNLYFAHEFADGLCYVVEVETKGGNISMETINEFLDTDILH